MTCAFYSRSELWFFCYFQGLISLKLIWNFLASGGDYFKVIFLLFSWLVDSVAWGMKNSEEFRGSEWIVEMFAVLCHVLTWQQFVEMTFGHSQPLCCVCSGGSTEPGVLGPDQKSLPVAGSPHPAVLRDQRDPSWAQSLWNLLFHV